MASSLLLSGGLLACGSDGCGKKDAADPVPPLTTRPTLAPTPIEAVLEGSVRLPEGVEPPAFTPEDMERKVLDHTKRAEWPAECTPPKILDSVPMRPAPDGALSGVVVAVSGFKQAYKRAPRTHDVVIRDCRLTPSTIVAMTGDKLRVTSEVKYPFMPAYGPPSAVRTLMPGQKYEVELSAAGVSPLSCGFTAPCGRTDVVVLLHPLAAVTDDKGYFRIDSFPAGERVTVTAWHPLLAESETQVELAPGESKTVELTARLADAQPAQAPGTGGSPAAPSQPPTSSQPASP